MKALVVFARALFALAILLLLVTTNLRLAISSTPLYQYGFDRYGVVQASGIERPELKRVAGALVDYFNSDAELFNMAITRYGQPTRLFTDLESEHFKDVKELVQFDYRAQLAALAYVAAFALAFLLWRRKGAAGELGIAARWGAWLTLGCIGLLGLAMLVGFDQVFLGFHLAFFNNDLWVARPGAIMTTLFTQEFFRDAALLVAAATVAEAALLWWLGRLTTRRWSSSTTSTRSSRHPSPPPA